MTTMHIRNCLIIVLFFLERSTEAFNSYSAKHLSCRNRPATNSVLGSIYHNAYELDRFKPSLSTTVTQEGKEKRRYQPNHRRVAMTKLHLNVGFLDDDLSSSPPYLLIAGVAIALLVSAQTFINQLLEGDEGLGAYLRDGTGYNRSGFGGKRSAFTKPDERKQDDPLPWLKLPQLDFVEVAGQDQQRRPAPPEDSSSVSEIDIYERLESLRAEMNMELQKGNIAGATSLKDELERLMKVNGIEYKPE